MAKKVGILFGMEDTFPWAVIEKINELGNGDVIAGHVEHFARAGTSQTASACHCSLMKAMARR